MNTDESVHCSKTMSGRNVMRAFSLYVDLVLVPAFNIKQKQVIVSFYLKSY